MNIPKYWYSLYVHPCFPLNIEHRFVVNSLQEYLLYIGHSDPFLSQLPVWEDL
jgi:hypothetical protein